MVQRRAPIYDKAQDGHYNLISALHKTVRGSDPDAALYYFARMLDAGEDPLFLARRLIRMAVEDIGLADPQALPQAVAARDAYQMLGSPEGELALAQVVVYLALAPKSNAVYTAFKGAMSVAKATGSPMPPMVILNAPTKLMKGAGLWRGLYLRPRHARGLFRPGVLSRKDRPAEVLRAGRARLRARAAESGMDYFERLRAQQKARRRA